MPFLDLDDASVFWRTDGHPNRPALVLANSLGSDTALWDGVIPRLVQHYHVIRLDLPGHGASRLTGSKDEWTVAGLAAHVLKAADAAGASEFDFAGISIGGMIGLELAAHSSRVKRLIVSNTASTSDPKMWADRIRTIKATGLHAAVDATMQRWFSPGFLKSDTPLLATIREHFLQVDLRGYTGCSAAIRDLDLQAGLPRIQAPTLVISGENDTAMPAGSAQAITRAIPGARHVELPTYHIPHIEDPAPFIDAVLAHLRP